MLCGMATVPTTEPLSVFAGDTLTWKKTLTNYPASAGWTLRYRLINAAAKIDIIAAASGDDHLVTVAAATSTAYAAGTYDWQSYVTNAGGERYTIEQGSMDVLANWAGAAAGLETRSTAQQILDVLEAQWLKAATNRAYVFEYQVAGRKMKFATRQEWVIELDYWRREVAREKRAARLAAGRESGRKVYVRF